MINYLVRKAFRPINGWDPISADYAASYIARNRENLDKAMLQETVENFGISRNPKLLDLGGGPGYYSVALAKAGFDVTLFDTSNRYIEHAKRLAEKSHIQLNYVNAWLDEAGSLCSNQFDVVFSRIAWNYGRSDNFLAKAIFDSLKPGGGAIIKADTGNSALERGARLNWQYWLNSKFSIKVGHPTPPQMRLLQVMSRCFFEQIEYKVVEEMRDLVICKRKYI